MNLLVYNKIKERYDSFYKSILRSGKLPMRSTEKGFWGYAIADEIFAMCKRFHLDRYRNFLDIGSGDGKVALIAALFVKNSFGIEINYELIQKSLEIKHELNIENAKFYRGDFLNFGFSRFDVIFCNPDTPVTRYIEKKLIKELKGVYIHYGNHFHPNYLNKVDEFYVNNTRITLYRR